MIRPAVYPGIKVAEENLILLNCLGAGVVACEFFEGTVPRLAAQHCLQVSKIKIISAPPTSRISRQRKQVTEIDKMGIVVSEETLLSNISACIG